MFYLMYEVPAPSTVGEKTANKKKMTKEIHKIWKKYIYFDNLKKTCWQTRQKSLWAIIRFKVAG